MTVMGTIIDWGLYRPYYRDPFPHSLLRTRQSYSQSRRFWDCFVHLGFQFGSFTVVAKTKVCCIVRRFANKSIDGVFGN